MLLIFSAFVYIDVNNINLATVRIALLFTLDTVDLTCFKNISFFLLKITMRARLTRTSLVIRLHGHTAQIYVSIARKIMSKTDHNISSRSFCLNLSEIVLKIEKINNYNYDDRVNKISKNYFLKNNF